MRDNDKPDDKKTGGGETQKPSGLGGLVSRFGGGKKEEDKPADKKSGADADSRASSSPLSGIASRLGGGKKEDDKPADRRSNADADSRASSSPLSGIASRLGGGKKEDPGTPASSSSSGARTSGGAASSADAPRASGGGGITSGLGGIASRFGGSKKEDEKPAASSQSAAGATSSAAARRTGTNPTVGGTSASSSASSSVVGGSRFPGSGGSTAASGEKPAVPKSQTQSAAAATSDGGMFGQLRQRLPFLGGAEDDKKAASARTSKTRASKVPQTTSEGLSLDTKLDILGVFLVFGALMLFFSAISPTPGALTGSINTFFAQMLGWGAAAVPVTMGVIGLWLIGRHFGETAPQIDTIRIVGFAMAYAGLLILFQYIETFNIIYQDATPEALNLLFKIGIDAGRGGGSVGALLYMFILTNIGEVGGVFVLLGWFVVSIMFITRTSAAELVLIVGSVVRSFQISMQRRAQRREALRLEAEQQRQLVQAQQISVSRPAIAELPAAPIPAALPSPSAEKDQDAVAIPIEERSIPIRMGGQMVTAPVSAEAPPAPSSLPGVAAALPRTDSKPAEPKPEESGGRLGGFAARLRSAVPAALPSGLGRGGKPEDEAGKKPDEEKSDDKRLRTMFGRPSADAAASAQTAPAAQSATTSQPTASAAPAPAAQPAASAAPQEEPMAPARPKGIGVAPRPEPTSRFAQLAQARPAGSPSGNDDEADNEADETPVTATGAREAQAAPPATGQSTPAAAGTAAAPAEAEAETGKERMDRLNELRSGMTASRPATESRPAASAAAGTSDAVPAATDPQAAPPAGTGSIANRIRPFGASSGEAAKSTGTTPAAASAEPKAEPRISSAPAASAPTAPSEAGPVRPGVVLPKAPEYVEGQALQRNKRVWTMPELRSLLSSGSEQDFDRENLVKRARTIEETLQSFGAPGRVVEINTGPVITQFGVEPDYLMARGGKKSRVKVSAIAQLDKDLQLALNAKSIRIEAPVPGKGFVGIEVPNDESVTVNLRDVMESKEFQRIKSPLAIALGQSVDGAPVAADLASMPHLLIAGTTGSGKSVCVNAIIASLILRNPPDRVKFIMVDPKRVELTGYNGIPHLVAPVVVELERIVGVLKWVTREMDERYKRFSNAGARNIEDYNKHLSTHDEPMPYIVVIIDELADLMMLAPDETERVVTRIAALARATGIHLVIATQRPSVDVVTGLIKANFPARIAFAVASGVDSRVILDQPGAERLLGRGDMLYMSGDSPAPQRLQGVFVSDAEINNMTRYWRGQGLDDGAQRPITALVMEPTPSTPAAEAPKPAPKTPPQPVATQRAFWDTDAAANSTNVTTGSADDDDVIDGEDEMYEEAVELVRRLNKASVSLLQRRLRIGYTRAARLIDIMEERGVVGPATEGSKPRDVLPQRR